VAGTECRVLERRDTWIRIQLADRGTVGWVTAGSLEPVSGE
jgi:hypothetical protein